MPRDCIESNAGLPATHLRSGQHPGPLLCNLLDAFEGRSWQQLQLPPLYRVWEDLLSSSGRQDGNVTFQM